MNLLLNWTIVGHVYVKTIVGQVYVKTIVGQVYVKRNGTLEACGEEGE